MKNNALILYQIVNFCKKKNNTNVLQMADRGLHETAYDVSHATALLLLYIEIVAIASQLVDTLLYLLNTNLIILSYLWIIY